MSTSPHRVRVAQSAATPSSRAHKQFNTLIKKLEAERARLAAWQEALPAVNALAEGELKPLEQRFDAQRKQLVLLFDQAHAHKAMGKRDKDKLADLICTIAEAVLGGGQDAELEALYSRHSGLGNCFDDDGADPALKSLMEELLGVQLGDADYQSPEALFQAMSAKMEEEAEQEQQAAQARAAARPKSAKALAREQAQQAEAGRLQQSVRDIYRKLASLLHPDREPDLAERQRKTGLMQRVNVAYAANDLLGLLELQLEVEQIDQAGLDGLSEERIAQYNKLLSGQVRELERENAGLEYAAMVQWDCPSYQRLTPKTLQKHLRTRLGELQSHAAALEQDLVDFQDLKRLKVWLKTYRLPEYDDAYDLFG